MRVPEKHIVVTQNTTAADIAKFMKTGGDADHSKLVAKRDANGDAVLFFKSNAKSSWTARISGKAADRRELARTTLENKYSEVVKKAKANNAVQSLQDAFVAVRNTLNQNDGHALRLDDLKPATTALAIFEKRAPAIAHAPPTDAAATVTVTTKMEDAPLPKSMIAENLGGGATIKLEGGVTTQLPDIKLNGAEYAPLRHLASGGFGAVYLYENKANPNDKLAMKAALPGATAEERASVENEYVRHGEVTTAVQNHPNVLALKGGVRLANGGVGMLMEYAPGGSLKTFAEALKANEGDGPGRTPHALADAIRSHMLAQTAEGLAALHDKGFAHADVKDPNVILDAKGVPKLADYGETTTKMTAAPLELRQGDNPRFASYDLLYAKEQNINTANLAHDAAFNASAADGHDLAAALSALGLSNIDATAAVRSLRLAVGEHARDTKENDMRQNGGFKTVDTKANDAWGLGVIATRLATGEGLLQRQAQTDPTDAVLNFKEGAPLQRRDSKGLLPKDALAAASDIPDFNDLIEAQFTRNKDARLSAEGVAEHRAANLPGSKEADVHAFIPLQIQMGQLQQDWERVMEQTRALAGADGVVPAENLARLETLNEQATHINDAIQTLLPDFELAKSKALTAIANARVLELDQALKGLDALAPPSAPSLNQALQELQQAIDALDDHGEADAAPKLLNTQPPTLQSVQEDLDRLIIRIDSLSTLKRVETPTLDSTPNGRLRAAVDSAEAVIWQLMKLADEGLKGENPKTQQ
jgi:serine/threonine protein kinase